MADVIENLLNNAQRNFFDGLTPNQYLKDMPLLNTLLMKGKKIKDVKSIKALTMTGKAYEWSVPYKPSVGAGVYGWYDSFPAQATNFTVNPVDFPSKYVQACAISGSEIRQNSGAKDKLFDMQGAALKNAYDTLMQLMATDLAGSQQVFAYDKRTLPGLQTIVNDSNTYAGIDRTLAQNAFWKSYVNSSSVSVANLKDINNVNSLPNIMRKMELKASFNYVAPDVYYMDKGLYNLYKEIAQVNNLRFDYNEADLNFETIKFGRITMLYDDYLKNASVDLGDGNAHSIYALSSGDWEVRTYAGANMEMLGDGWKHTIVAQKDVYVAQMYWEGVIVCKEPRRQAVANNLAAS